MKPSALVDTRVIYCGDNIEPLAKLPEACVRRRRSGRSLIDAFFRKSGRIIIPLRVEEIINEEIARKLA
jgi:hypothetical protein